MLRVGHGFDAHRFGPGDHVTLGGVRIPHRQGIVAHSDGDVLVHALCDALLGAAGLGDIGRHFPDSDPAYRNADSRTLLRRTIGMLGERRFQVVNADLTLIAEQPRVHSHVARMRQLMADDLGLDLDAVNLKATTTEGMGWIGREEGLAAHALVLIETK